MKILRVLLTCLVMTGAAAGSQEQSDERTPAVPSPPSKRSQLLMKTLGGRQFWGDLHYFHDWRIQQHIRTKHCRLLDGDDVRHCSGSLQECLDKLKAIRTEQQLPPMKGKAVILVHGIVRSSKSFGAMETQLASAGYQVFGFDYPSTQISIPESASYLRKCIQSLEGIEEINFVVHSMGGLVVRSMLAECQDARFRRMVMLGVPNKGAEMADTFRRNPFFKAVFGPAGQQLVTGAAGFIGELPTPTFEFGVLAGARGNPKGYNPLIPGDDDGTVALRSTRLPGATDFITRPVLHSFLMYNKECIDCTLHYLKHGRFLENQPARPIPVPETPAPEVASPSEPRQRGSEKNPG